MGGDTFQLILLGDGGVGKTTLTTRYVKDKFVEVYNPTVSDEFTHVQEIDGEEYTLEIVDIGGQEEFKSMRDRYMRQSDGYILMFDLTNYKSFRSATNTHYETVLRNREKSGALPILLVGNKSDLEDKKEVDTDYAEAFAEEKGWGYIESSAKTRDNVDDVFIEITKRVVEHYETNPRPTEKPGSAKGDKGSGEKKRRCVLY